MARKLLSVTALISGAIIPACIIGNPPTGNPPFDEDADPCPPVTVDANVYPDAGNPPWYPDARHWPDAAPVPDAAPGIVQTSTLDAGPPPCPVDAHPPDVDATLYPDAAVVVPDAAPL